jgi:hypothetical protein
MRPEQFAPGGPKPTKRRTIMDKILTLPQWINASIDQRHQWLVDNFELDERSSQIHSWWRTFVAAGAIISEENVLKVYELTVK